MKTMKRVPRIKRSVWMGLNLLSILSMLAALLLPVPVVQAQASASNTAVLASPSTRLSFDNNQPKECALGGRCALHFNGVNQWMQEDAFRGLDTASFTVESWVKWSGGGSPIPGGNNALSGKIPIIMLGGGSATALSDLKLLFGIDAEHGELFTGFSVRSSETNPEGGFYSLTGSTSLTLDEWHHVAATYDGQVLRLYVDGIVDAELNLETPVTPDLVGASSVTLAAAFPSTAEKAGFFKGSLDEVRIWEVARPQADLISSASQEKISDANLIGYWMMNEGKGSEINDSSGKGNRGHTQNDPLWSEGAPMALSSSPEVESLPAADAAPGSPTLVSPQDGATNVSSSPSLDVNVSDPDGGNLTVTYYGRIAAVSQPDFTMIALPDTQKYAVNGLGIFGTQTQWVVDQRSNRNIVFVGHLGDMGDDYNVPSEWNIVSAAMGKLESAGIPYGITPGNCDEDNWGVPPNTTYYNAVFPVSRFAGKPWYGGSYNNDTANSYQLISASGIDFIIIEIKFNVSYDTNQGQAILTWANNLLHTYSNRKAIILTHYLLDTSNTFSADGAMIYNALKGNPNLFLMMGGHLDDEGMRTDSGTDGHTIYSLRSDYQTRANGGNGWLRILRFSPDNNKIYVTTYTPYLNQFETDANSQFELPLAMGGGGFDEIGSVSVPSGTKASVTWPNLDASTQYQWYVTAADGTSTTTSATWSFTTASAGESAPVVTTQPVNQTVNPNQTATFAAAASGNPTPTVQWQVSSDNGSTWSDIPGATSPTYSLTAQAGDSGKQFKAIFTNSGGSVATNAATLTVNTPPIVTTQPSSLTVVAGQTASFTAAASGTPAPTVQWEVSSNNGSTWNNISGATSPNYSFTTSSADNGKQFKAIFTNAAGSATTNAAILTVQMPPVITTQPANQTVNAGEIASFTAAASGSPTPSVQWQLSINNGSSWSNISTANSSTYSFVTSPSDNGNQYRAVFTNSAGSATSNAAILTLYTGPVITTNPTDQTVILGNSVSFAATATGNPSPSVQWQSSSDGTTWSNIPGATSTTYSFTPASGDNGKQFRAIFSNSLGSATTTAATLVVYYGPTITLQPVQQSVIAGEPVTFSAAAEGNSAPTMHWEVSTDNHNWSDLPGETSSPLTFTAQSTDDGKYYRAYFVNNVAEVASNSAMLTVSLASVPPSIITNPVSQVVTAGQPVTFTASASGTPTPTVQWQVSTDGNIWNDISGATGISYSFTALASDNGRQYRAVFSNTAGSAVTTAATLTVNTLPVVTAQPVSQTVIEGQPASFSASASGSPLPTIQWQVSPNGNTWNDIAGATNETYAFTAQAADNGHQYRAVFTNAAGSVTSNAAQLTVNVPPTVTTQPTHLSVNAGQRATFTAAGSGSPVPTVQWQVSIDGNTWADISGANSTTYAFTTSSADNGKQYHAVFTNTAGTATSNPAALNVNFSPVITQSPANQAVNAGQTANFSAAAAGNPAPSVQWQVSTNGTTWSNINGANSPTYSISTLSSDNGKQFRAFFTNAIGSATSSPAVLTVYFAPAITTQPSNQTVPVGQTASFTAAASGNPVPGVQWQFSTDGANWTNVSGAISVPYTFIVQAADTGKSFRAVFTNSAGSATSNPALLTVTSDLIFKDEFNACNSSAWNGGATNPTRLAFNTASGRNSTCGMGVTLSGSSAAYLTDGSPANEKSLHARVYIKPNTLKLPNNGSMTLFAGYTSASKMVVSIQVHQASTAYQLRAGILSDSNSWSYTNWVTVSNAWHSAEIAWSASTSTTANNGTLTFYVDGTQSGTISGRNNDTHSIDKVSVGAVTGQTAKSSGLFFVDDYESRRLTVIGQ
jgi:hypothetical protein